MDELKSFLRSEIIWKDEHMFELKVTASNSRYYGTSQVYDVSESLSNFAKSLVGFPKDDKSIKYEAGEKDSSRYFSMKFYSIDSAGHIGVEVALEENIATVYGPEEKNRVTLTILVDPNAIDEFQKMLYSQAIKQEGEAVLKGYLDNSQANADS